MTNKNIEEILTEQKDNLKEDVVVEEIVKDFAEKYGDVLGGERRGQYEEAKESLKQALHQVKLEERRKGLSRHLDELEILVSEDEKNGVGEVIKSWRAQLQSLTQRDYE